jgi:hypothetical protein
LDIIESSKRIGRIPSSIDYVEQVETLIKSISKKYKIDNGFTAVNDVPRQLAFVSFRYENEIFKGERSDFLKIYVSRSKEGHIELTSINNYEIASKENVFTLIKKLQNVIIDEYKVFKAKDAVYSTLFNELTKRNFVITERDSISSSLDFYAGAKFKNLKNDQTVMCVCSNLPNNKLQLSFYSSGPGFQIDVDPQSASKELIKKIDKVFEKAKWLSY